MGEGVCCKVPYRRLYPLISLESQYELGICIVVVKVGTCMSSACNDPILASLNEGKNVAKPLPQRDMPRPAQSVNTRVYREMHHTGKCIS